MTDYRPIYPPAFTGDYVNATDTGQSALYYDIYAFSPLIAITGGVNNTTWLTGSGNTTNQKYNVDCGSAFVLGRVYLENVSNSGTLTDYGIKNFSVYGTNSATAFANVTYANTTDLTLLGTFQATEHPATDTEDPQYFTITGNTTEFRYYVLRIVDNHGNATGLGFRHIEFQVALADAEYPTEYSTTTVKATSNYTGFDPHLSCDPSLPIIGSWSSNQWVSNTVTTNQKFNIDYGTAFVLESIYLENGHTSGTETDSGMNNFLVYGTNSATAFANTTYATTTDLTLLGTFQAAEHRALDIEDPQFFTITGNTTAYRYYVLRIADNHGDTNYITIRHIELVAAASGGTTHSLSASCDIVTTTNTPALGVVATHSVSANCAIATTTSTPAINVTHSLSASCAVVISTNTPTLLAGLKELSANCAITVSTNTPVLTNICSVTASCAIATSTSEFNVVASANPVSASCAIATTTSTAEIKLTKSVSASCSITTSTSTSALTTVSYLSSSSDIVTSTNTPELVASRVEISANCGIVTVTDTPILGLTHSLSSTAAIVTTTSTAVVSTNICTITINAPSPTFKFYTDGLLSMEAGTPIFTFIGTNSIIGTLGFEAPSTEFTMVGDSENVSTLDLVAPAAVMGFVDTPGSMGYLDIQAPAGEFSFIDVGDTTGYILDVQAPLPIFSFKVDNTPDFNILRHVRGTVR